MYVYIYIYVSHVIYRDGYVLARIYICARVRPKRQTCLASTRPEAHHRSPPARSPYLGRSTPNAADTGGDEKRNGGARGGKRRGGDEPRRRRSETRRGEARRGKRDAGAGAGAAAAAATTMATRDVGRTGEGLYGASRGNILRRSAN